MFTSPFTEDMVAKHRFASLRAFVEKTQNALGASQEEKKMCELVQRFIDSAQVYYDQGVRLSQEGINDQKLIAQRQRQLVDRLSTEWSTLMSFISAPRFLPQNDDTVKALQRVIRRAWRDLNRGKIERNDFAVLPHYNRNFELVTFDYAPEIAMIGLPVTSVYSPWDWTMIWHEMAGLYMQSEFAHEMVDSLDKLLVDNDIWPRWLRMYPKYTEHLPRETDANGEAMDMPAKAVRLGWVAEAVEDSIAVLCLGDVMAEALGRFLRQHYESQAVPQDDVPVFDIMPPSDAQGGANAGTAVAVFGDLRHPPAKLRELIAQSLSYQMGLTDYDVNDPGAKMLAEAIFGKRKDLVSRVFTNKDAENVDATLDELASGEAKANSYPAYILIPALVKGVANGRITQENTQSIVQKNLVNHTLPAKGKAAAKNPLLPSFKRIKKWDILFNQKFSHVDRGDAQASGSEYKWGIWNVLPVSVSNVWSHGNSHGPFSVNYYHSH